MSASPIPPFPSAGQQASRPPFMDLHLEERAWQEFLDAPDPLDISEHNIFPELHRSSPDHSQQVQQRRLESPGRPDLLINMDFFYDNNHNYLAPQDPPRSNPPAAGPRLNSRVIQDSDRESSFSPLLDRLEPDRNPIYQPSEAGSVNSADFDSSQEVEQNEGDAEPWDLGSDEAAALFEEGGSPPSSLGDDGASQNRRDRQNMWNRAHQPSQANEEEDLFVSDHSLGVEEEDEDDDLLMLDAAPARHWGHRGPRAAERHRSRHDGQRGGAGARPAGEGTQDWVQGVTDDNEEENLPRRNLRERDYSSGFRDMLRHPRRRSASPSRHPGTNGGPARHANNHRDGQNSEVRRGPRIGIDELIDVEFDLLRPLHHRLPSPLHQINRDDNNNNNNNIRNPRSMASPNRLAEIIDLTEDSPPAMSYQMALPQDPRQARNARPSRNPRRGGPRFSRNPPAFAPSDGSALGAQLAGTDVIDLTDDADEDVPSVRHEDHDVEYLGDRLRAARQAGAREEAARQARQTAAGRAPGIAPIEDFLQRHRNDNQGISRLVQNAIQHFGFPNFPFLSLNFNSNRNQNMNANQNPLGPNGVPNLDYGLAAFANNAANVNVNANPDKPAYREPSPAPEGFTRNTGAEGFAEDEIAICPGCDEELAYDPDSDGGEESDKPTPAKKGRGGGSKKTKKSSEKHHLWALKECGHVYCSRCYNNRSKTNKGWDQTLWRLPNGEVADGTTWKEVDKSVSNGRKVFCAVEGCNTDVKSPSAWVGIFM